MQYFFIIACLLTCPPTFADIYTYKNSEGQFYFTDKQMDKSYKLLSIFRANLTTKTNIKYSMNSYKHNKVKYLPLIATAAQQYQIDPDLLHAIVDTESAFNPDAISKVGAIGLMQLMPKTAKGLNVKDIWNPKQNIQGGAKYISQLLTMFDQSKTLALAAYNAGPTSVRKANNNIPNYPETQRYVKKVMTKYKSLK